MIGDETWYLLEATKTHIDEALSALITKTSVTQTSGSPS